LRHPGRDLQTMRTSLSNITYFHGHEGCDSSQQMRQALALVGALIACDKANSSLPSVASPPPDVTSTPVGEPITAWLTDPPFVPNPIVREAPARVKVELEVLEIEKEIAPGVRYTVWTFGGHVPGKFIRVRQGDIVELTLQNHPDNKLPHNIDLHAVTGPGGGAEPTFIAPGKQTTFTFRALNPGLYVYHCATAPVPMHVANGMYGLIFVEPPGGLPPVNHEYYVMQGELYTTGKYHEQGVQEFDMQKGIDEKPTYVLFNGAEGSLVGDKALRARTGDRIRMYVGNGGPNLTSSFHVIGEIFDRVYSEGGTNVHENVQTTTVPAGGASIVEFTVEVPGKYIIVDHALFRAFNKGAIGTLEVSGESRNDLYTTKGPEVSYTGTKISAVPAATPPAPKGEATYARVCSACHQPDGRGLTGAFPPVAQSDYLKTATKAQIIDHVLRGAQGPMTVNGTTYNGVMPPMAFLTDDEIANVLTYVRTSWGNGLDAVTTDDVAKARGAQ
jgi:nitrite reductase (NO-forming)